ncbi:MAG: LysR family transcriptional regulator [Actinomycetota bacterium]|nr:LysR family transcriptional regulator [Actinomycetota bacterium]
MLNPVHLRTLAMVVLTGSFADAARRLGYTASAVSQQIAALERSVRMPLFDRDAHSIRPTPAAEFLASRSHEVLAALGALEEDVRSMAEGTIGRLRLGSFPTASEQLLPRALPVLISADSHLEIHLDEGEPDELVPLLNDRELDLAIVYRYDLVPRSWPKGLRATELMVEDLFLLLPADHRLVGQPVSLNDLRDEKWISTREGSSGASSLRRICAQADFVPAVDYRSNDYDVVRGFVRSGLGIALVPALGHVVSEGVAVTTVDDLRVQRHVIALHSAARPNPAVAGAIGALQSAADSLTNPGIHTVKG